MILKKLIYSIIISIAMLLATELGYAAVPISDGFDYPVGVPNGEGYRHGQTIGGDDGWGFLENEGNGIIHPGEDWNRGSGDTDLGDPVYAVSNGRIIAATNYGKGWGNIVLVEHKLYDGTTVWSNYAHLRDINVSNGNVQRGQQIGTIGKGYNNQYWAHLHFEIRKANLASNAWVTDQGQTQILTNYYNPSDFINNHRPRITPVIGDWNNDNIDNKGTFNPHTSTFSLDNGVNQQFGEPGDLPIVGDWDGDGSDTIGIYRPKTAQFFLDNNNDGARDYEPIAFGIAGDIPIIGDWDADGKDNIGIFRSSDLSGLTTFYLDSNNDGVADSQNINFGLPSDIPIVGDWNNDGKDDIGVFRRNDPANNNNAVFYLKNGAETISILYGINDDIPIIGKPYSDNQTRIGVYRSSVQDPFIFKPEALNASVKEEYNNTSSSDMTIVQPATSTETTIKVYRTATGQIDILNIESEYLPYVVAGENGAAHFESMKAQAIASRAYAYYKKEHPSGSNFDVYDNQKDQVYNPNLTLNDNHKRSVSETNGILLKYNNIIIAGFYVRGLDSTKKYVTHNEGKSGDYITQSSIGQVTNPPSSNPYNRGCMGQIEANGLATSGYTWEKILKYFYGEDIVIEPVENIYSQDRMPSQSISPDRNFEINSTFPNIPTSLIQYKSDGVTGILLGSTTDENTVIMQGGVSDPTGDPVQLEVEVKPVNMQFAGTPTSSSQLVTSGSIASVTCTDLPNEQYHWQARAKNSNGIEGPWLSAGGNAEDQIDFIVSEAAVDTATPLSSDLSSSNTSEMNYTTPSIDDNAYTVRGNTGSEKPTASFDANVTSGPAPLKVLFTSSVTGDPTSYFWQFEPSTSSDWNSKHPITALHTFKNPGVYTVNLTVSNDAGSTTITKENYITVM
ncbi:MAG: peptidoglycan DD-metalloendopeptidase family protein [Methanosarcina sp.]